MISILVAVYNVEPYIRRCLDSIICQTYDDLEIIIVNDGSSDSSGDICEEYAKIDSRIQIIHQPNGGLSVVRNAGLDAATGDYIGFIDGDDYIEPDMYQHLYQVMMQTGADIVQCKFLEHKDDSSRPAPQNGLSGEYSTFTLYGFDAVMECLADKLIAVSVCGNLYKAEIFEDVHFSLGFYGQDTIIFPDIVAKCSSFTKTDLKLYHYCRRDDSTTKTEKTQTHLKSRIKVIDTYMRIYNDPARVSAKKSIAFFLCYALAKRQWNLAMKKSSRISSLEKKEYYKLAKKIARTCYNDARNHVGYKKRPIYEKVCFRMFCLSPTIYLYVVRFVSLFMGK